MHQRNIPKKEYLMTRGFHATDRSVIEVAGKDAVSFLQGIVTNDVENMQDGESRYCALLSPKGKYLFDFFVTRSDQVFLLDLASPRAGALEQRLSMYRLRAEVAIRTRDLQVIVGTGQVPENGMADPRDRRLGWRALTDDPDQFLSGIGALARDAYEAARIDLAVPETGSDLLPDESYILEAGFERLNGVDFRKGCYVGQEVTARMKHKAELKKGLLRVLVEGEAPPAGTEIVADGKPAGRLNSTARGKGLAFLRFDRIRPEMSAGNATVRLVPETS